MLIDTVTPDRILDLIFLSVVVLLLLIPTFVTPGRCGEKHEIKKTKKSKKK